MAATSTVWRIAEPDLPSVFQQHRLPLDELAAGQLPRIVLATFIGYSKDRNEIFVWS